MRAILIPLVFAISTGGAAASDDAWKPEARFHLGDLTLRQSMLWISGVSYALSATGRRDEDPDYTRLFCTPENGQIGSRVLFEILNEKFENATITAEQAIAEIMRVLPKRFPC